MADRKDLFFILPSSFVYTAEASTKTTPPPPTTTTFSVTFLVY
jgi:hypothetical protein